MKRIFLDTNILIDYIDNRAGADNAEQIFACGFSGEALLFASSLTFSNMAYIIKGRTQEEKYDCDYIVTNDRRHYDFSDIPHLTSASFVDQIDVLIK
jgi:predicted nucleic acid-binding protein